MKQELKNSVEKLNNLYNEILSIKGYSLHKKDLIKHYAKLYNELKEYCRWQGIYFKELGIKGLWNITADKYYSITYCLIVKVSVYFIRNYLKETI